MSASNQPSNNDARRLAFVIQFVPDAFAGTVDSKGRVMVMIKKEAVANLLDEDNSSDAPHGHKPGRANKAPGRE